jgi:carbonic anhydrase
VTLEVSVDFIDHAAHDAIEHWRRQHEATGGTVLVREVGAVELRSALSGPPSRAFATVDKRLGSAPWSSWQNHPHRNGHEHHDSPPRAMLDGLEVYHRRMAPHPAAHAEAGRESAGRDLFITCTDSRIIPNALTCSGPGDMFTLRNIGNLVPSGQLDSSVEAAIAYAVDRLEVCSIVVCGHSGCSAMAELLGESGATNDAGDEHLAAWLAHAQPAVAAFDSGRHPIAQAAAAKDFDPVDQLGMVNVAIQVETLMNHPRQHAARRRPAQGDRAVLRHLDRASCMCGRTR